MMWAYLIELGSNMWSDFSEGAVEYPFQERLITEDAVWRETIDFLPAHGFNTVVIDLGDAVQYETHPEIAIPGAWPKDKLRAELDRMRGLGLTPIPKLNFSACHDAWMKQYSRMVATPEYYKVCADLIAEVAELFGCPKYFHLGMDEESSGAQKWFLYTVIRKGDLWWHDIYYFFDQCEKVGARPWVWADAGWKDPDTYLRRMPKSVLQSNWFYERMRKNPDGTYVPDQYNYYLTLDRAGFDQVATCSTIFHPYNARQTMELGKESLSPERLVGYMTAPWVFTRQEDRYGLLNDAQRFWFAKRDVYGCDA